MNKKKLVVCSIVGMVVLSALAAQVLRTDEHFGGSTRFVSPSAYQVSVEPLDNAVLKIDFINKPAGVFTNFSNPIYLTRTGLVATVIGSSSVINWGIVTDYTSRTWTNVGPLWAPVDGLNPPQTLVNDSLQISPFKIHVTDDVSTTNMLTIRNLYLGWTSDARIDGSITAGTGFYGNGNTLTNSNLNYTTNNNPVTPDFTVGYQLFSTNAAFTFLAPVGVDTTKLSAQTTVVLVTNSTAAAVAVTAPANVHIQGTWFVTNVTSFTFFCYAQQFTNAYAFPLW